MPKTDTDSSENYLGALQKRVFDKMGAITSLVKKHSVGDKPMKSHEEHVKIVEGAMGEGAEGIVKALEAEGCLYTEPAKEEEAEKAPKDEEGGNPFGDKVAKSPIEDMRKKAASAAFPGGKF